MERHGVQPDHTTVVRTGPDPGRLRPVGADPRLRRGRDHLVAYIGVMGPQDGVNIVLEVADLIINKQQRKDVTFTLIGSGDCFNDLVELRDRLNLVDFVEFTGRVPDEAVAAILSSADVGISPDPKNPLNDLSTMNKTMEYMAFQLPVAAFDLRETRASAAEAGVYAVPNQVDDLARILTDLIDDEPRRLTMGAAGRARWRRSWPGATRRPATSVCTTVYWRATRNASRSPQPNLVAGEADQTGLVPASFTADVRPGGQLAPH